MALYITCACLFHTGCNDSVQDMYTRIPAYFIHNYTNTVPQLNAALNSPGEFAVIRSDRQYFLFTNLIGTTQVNATALNNYGSFQMGRCGFIVGLPNIPEPGADFSKVVCFDLVCANCDRDQHISPRLELREAGQAECTRCKRTYNLNSGGIVSKGTAGISLYRYRVTYNDNTLIIRNR